MNNILCNIMSKICKRVADSVVDVYRDGSVLELAKFQMREIMEKINVPEKHVLLDHENEN